MSVFKIEIIKKKPIKIDNFFYYMGELIIGEFKDTFELALGSWDVHEYRLQWKEGLERLKTYNTSCLVVCVQDLQNIPFIERWKLYKENTIVYFNQQFIIPPIAQVINFSFPLSEFSRTNCYERIPPRKVNENGEAIDDNKNLLCEWSIEYKAIEEFAHSFKP